jgi:cobalt-zinc-cadmium efflux system membrane fusion protein
MTTWNLWQGRTSSAEANAEAPHAHAAGHDHNHDGDAAHAQAPRDPNRLWCAEHGVYEDECTICHPELATAKADGALMCPEHRLLESECGNCHAELAAGLAPGQGLKVRLASVDAAEQAGIATGFPASGQATEALTALSRVAYNENRTAHVSARVAGVLGEVHAEVGETVQAGEVLAELTAPELAEARADYLAAVEERDLRRVGYERERGLAEKGISPRKDFLQAEKDYREADIRVRAARERLRALGLAEGDLRAESMTLAIRAPFAGTVVERHAAPGEAVEPGTTLFTVTDLTSMWLELSIPEAQITAVAVGQPIQARFDAIPGLTFEGELAWLDSKVDPQLRIVRGRAVIPNPSGILRDGMFGRAELGVPVGRGGLELPSAAVQEMEGRPFVFVKLEDDLFEARRVALGSRDADRVEVVEGLAPTEEVALARSYTLKSELLKARLGAGCVHD